MATPVDTNRLLKRADWSTSTKKGLREEPLFVIGATGFEPATPCTPCKCATRLRHAPMLPRISQGRCC